MTEQHGLTWPEKKMSCLFVLDIGTLQIDIHEMQLRYQTFKNCLLHMIHIAAVAMSSMAPRSLRLVDDFVMTRGWARLVVS